MTGEFPFGEGAPALPEVEEGVINGIKGWEFKGTINNERFASGGFFGRALKEE